MLAGKLVREVPIGGEEQQKARSALVHCVLWFVYVPNFVTLMPPVLLPFAHWLISVYTQPWEWILRALC